ncbi:hypothetical protein SAMD00023353_11300130 [Rosellinia necatrix]|uniref:Uncharacterized protein n=1 Tax=Rosellinia necatrix TaxID=77044 RepID=A0A1W2TX29_ROSNE|nr:hypothetical protein SAMD00023353_11300130 [Rosellinia necatrix]
MANFFLKFLSALAIGAVAVQAAAAAAVPQDDEAALRPTRIPSMPAEVKMAAAAAEPTSTVGPTIHITSEIPVNTVLDEGSVFSLTWEDNGRTDSFVFEVFSFIIGNDTVPTETTIISPEVPFADLSYNWTVKAQPGRESLDYVYRFGVLYDKNGNLYFQQTYLRVFQINTDV